MITWLNKHNTEVDARHHRTLQLILVNDGQVVYLCLAHDHGTICDGVGWLGTDDLVHLNSHAADWQFQGLSHRLLVRSHRLDDVGVGQKARKRTIPSCSHKSLNAGLCELLDGI